MSKQLQRKPSKAEQLAAIKAARGMFRSKDGKPVDWTALKEEDRRLEKRRDDFLASIGKDKSLRTDLVELICRLKKR